jgi:hypothetical protein
MSWHGHLCSFKFFQRPTKLSTFFFFSLALMCLVMGCTSKSDQDVKSVAHVAEIKHATDPDDLMVVDCLLPGQVRKLGRQMSFLTPRRPVRTTALECRIRGGEYVSYDRANYETALAVWLLQAEQGDPEAQHYVGVIYQKGMGLEPDYAKAAEWYAKAAEQGYASSQVSLGYLYEQGLGVEKDPQQALKLYRRASGLPSAIELVDSREQKARQQEMADLKREVERWKSKAQELQARQSDVQEELDLTRSTLAQRQEQMQDAYERLTATRKRLEELREGEPQATAEPGSEQEDKVKTLQSELNASQNEMHSLEARLEKARQAERRALKELLRREEQIEEARKDLAQIRVKLNNIQGQSLSRNEQVQDLERQLEQREQELAETEAEVERLQARVQSSSQDDDASNDLLRERKEQMMRAYQRLQKSRQELEDLKSELKREHKAEVEKVRQRLVQRESELERYRGELAQLSRRASQSQEEKSRFQERLAAKQQELNRLTSQLEQKEKEIKRLRRAFEDRADAERVELEAELHKRQQELASKSATIEELKQKVETLTSQSQGLEAELARLDQQKEARLMPGPKIEIIEPPLIMSKTRGVQIVEVRYGVVDRDIIGKVEAPAGLMSLTVNGRDQRVEDMGLFRTRVPVVRSGSTVRIVAVDKQGQRAAMEFVLASDRDSGSAASESQVSTSGTSEKSEHFGIDFGKFHALIIGNTNYTNLPQLESAKKDAIEVADLLKSQYGFTTTLLLDASRYQILSELNRLRKKLTEKDNLLIYYAGHGELDKVNMRGYWLPINAEMESTANWISNIALTDILNIMSAKQILVVADSCYSGIMTRSSLTSLAAGRSEQAKQKWLKKMATMRARMVLTSGGLKPVLDAGGGGHSVFAKAFLQVLEENESLLVGQDLYRRVSSRVSYAVSTIGMEQIPEYAPLKFAGHETGDFFFVPLSGSS